MKRKVKFECYPEINDIIIEDSINFLNKNKEYWDPPFFFDTRTNLDIQKLQKTTEEFITDKLKNVLFYTKLDFICLK